MRRRAPRQEKARDYARQRRSRAWSSDKSDRKKRALAKAMEHRAERRAAASKMGGEPDRIEEAIARHRPKRHALVPVSVSLGEWLTDKRAKSSDS